MSRSLIAISLFALFAGCLSADIPRQQTTTQSQLAGCLSLADENRRATCIWHNVPNKTDLTICRHIAAAKHHQERVACHAEVALNTRDPSACQRIETVGSKEGEVAQCLIQVAAATKNETVCKMIPDKGWYADCLAQAA